MAAAIRGWETIVIGEAIAKSMGVLEQHFPQYEWRAVKDFRNMIVHEYFGVDERIVWDAVQLELGDIVKHIDILKDELR